MIKTNIIFVISIALLMLPYTLFSQNELNSKLHLKTAEDYLKVSKHYLELNKADSVTKYTVLGKAVRPEKEETIALLYFTESLNYFKKGDFKLALKEITFSETIFKENTTLNKSEKYGEILYKKGDYLQYLNKNSQALEHLLKAEKLVSDSNTKAGIYAALSSTHLNYNNLEKSLFYINKILSEPLINQIDDVYIAQAYASASVIYELEKELEKALSYDLKTIKIFKKKNKKINITSTYINAASTLKKLNKNKKALIYLDSAKQINNNLKNTYLKSAIKLNTAENYAALNMDNKAHQLFKESIKEFIDIGIVEGYTEGYIEESKLYIKQKRYNEAIESVKKGLESSKKNKLHVFKKEAYLLLYDIHKLKSGTTEALFYYEKYTEVKDFILSEEKRKDIENLKINFNVKELETQLQIKNDQLIINEEKRKSAIYFNLLLGIGVITLLFSLYRQLKLSKTKKMFFESEKQINLLKSEKLKKDIENKNKEVTSFALHINEKNELLSSVRKDIFKVNKTLDQSNKNKLRKIISNIDNTIKVNQEKAQLYSKIDEAKNSFHNTITLRYPELSNREIEIATYLRLNLSSKQISNHLNISQQTINNYRFKIRKKLNLDKEDDLTDFLKNL